MKIYRYLVLICLALINHSAHAETIVGSGSSYDSIFSPADSLTHDVPGGGTLLSLTLSDDSTTASSGIWDLTAQGGVNASLILLGPVIESAAQTALTGSALEFNISNDNDSLLTLLGVGTSVHYAWEATAYFDTPGSILDYSADTIYNISFNVDGNNGLLSSVLGLTPQFNFELIDGSGNALASDGSGTLIDIAGLLGSGVTSGTVNLSYTVDGPLPSGPIGMRFTGDALVGATALGLGTNFATITDLNIVTAPVPEPGSCMLIASVGVAVLLRRRRMHNLHAPRFA